MPPKKAAKHHHDSHHAAKDLRRAYEHLGRVEVLQHGLKSPAKDVTTLVDLAQHEVHGGRAKETAGLLRAAEHLCFAALLGERAEGPQPAIILLPAIQEEFEHLKEKAEEHWRREERDDASAAVYSATLSKANHALKAKAYREALELIRAAEALAHLKKPEKAKKHGPEKLAVSGRLQLSAS